MSLLETSELLQWARKALQESDEGTQYAAFTISVAAWFPFHFVEPEKDTRTFPSGKTSCGLGLDSTAIFLHLQFRTSGSTPPRSVGREHAVVMDRRMVG